MDSHPVFAKLVHILTTLVRVLFSSESSSIGVLMIVLNIYPSSSPWATPKIRETLKYIIAHTENVSSILKVLITNAKELAIRSTTVLK